jgi:1-acylglycerone phosphate reductase
MRLLASSNPEVRYGLTLNLPPFLTLYAGLQVLATARRKETIHDLSARGITTLAVDVNIPESVSQLKKDVQRITDGKLDYLVNNAGRNYTVPALDVDFEEVEETFKTNVFSVMRMCKEFAPLLIEAKGTIVQIGSLAGVMWVDSAHAIGA